MTFEGGGKPKPVEDKIEPLEGNVESREALGSNILKAAQEAYATEKGKLKSKETWWGAAGTVGTSLFFAPLALKGFAELPKMLGVDLGVEGIDLSILDQPVIGPLIGLASGIAGIGGAVAGLTSLKFGRKLNQLKKKFGMLETEEA